MRSANVVSWVYLPLELSKCNVLMIRFCIIGFWIIRTYIRVRVFSGKNVARGRSVTRPPTWRKRFCRKRAIERESGIDRRDWIVSWLPVARITAQLGGFFLRWFWARHFKNIISISSFYKESEELNILTQNLFFTVFFFSFFAGVAHTTNELASKTNILDVNQVSATRFWHREERTNVGRTECIKNCYRRQTAVWLLTSKKSHKLQSD